MIDIEGLVVTYKTDRGDFPAVSGFDLHLDKGDICALIGPSGCGKSTVLYVLSGIITQHSGQALIGGQPVDPQKQRIGLVPQNYGLLDWADVYHNATLGLRVKGSDVSASEPFIAHLMGKLGLEALRSKYPRQLSGGQQQRVAIARSFIMQPDVLLMDEPFSALDAMTREDIQDLFLSVWKEHATSTLFVTHSIEEAVYLGRKIAVMSPAPGCILREIDNPLFGKSGLRQSKEFYAFVMELREMVKEDWAV
jgi:ABC-type nitrate/sulfonate/bicarbonate transport system ATPase subunit